MTTENSHDAGDFVSRDKFQGDSVAGNKYEVIAYINSVKSSNLDNSTIENLKSLYLRWVYEECSRLPLGILDPSQTDPNNYHQTIRLESVYTALNVIDEVDLSEINSQNKNGDHVTQQKEYTTAIQTVISQPHLVIIGDHRAGKSTLLSHIGQIFSASKMPTNVKKYEDEISGWDIQNIFPVYIRFKDFTHWIPENSKGTFVVFLEILRNYFVHNGIGDATSLILEKIKNEECILLLDGLDEISDVKQIKIIRKMIQNMMAVLPSNRLLITCRTLTYSNPDWQMGLPTVKLAPLNDEQINRFITSWYETLVDLNRIDNKTGKSKTKELSTAITNFSDLARNPLILTVIALLHSFTGALPNERSRLYAHCVDLMLLRWHQTKISEENTKDDEKLSVRETDIKRALWEVAYQTHVRQQDEDLSRRLSQGEIIEILQKYIDNDWSSAKSLLDYIEKRTGLLISEGFDKFGRQIYSFPHRTFQEFLAGCYLASKRDFSRQAIQIVGLTESWHEVFLLAIGHLVLNQNDIVKPLDTANALYSTSIRTNDWKSVWWAAEVINLVGATNAKQDEVGSMLLPQISSKLKSITENPTIPPYARVQIGNLSGKLHVSNIANEVEPDLLPVKDGEFQMGLGDAELNFLLKNMNWAKRWHQNLDFNQEMPGHIVLLDSYCISKNVITNLQYNNFIIDNGYAKKEFWTLSGWEWKLRRQIDKPLYFEDRLSIYPFHPVVWLSWYEAKAYCNWLSKITNKNYDLPTEPQWERAAKGISVNIFPWGNEWNDGISNTIEIKIGSTSAVGIFPLDVSVEGCYDMGGNVREWCLSKYVLYPFIFDNRNAVDGEEGRVLRGGSFSKNSITSRCSNRFWDDPNYRASSYGFRVVKNV